jgi:hypothetical protein
MKRLARDGDVAKVIHVNLRPLGASFKRKPMNCVDSGRGGRL